MFHLHQKNGIKPQYVCFLRKLSHIFIDKAIKNAVIYIIGISYKPLFILLAKHDMKKTDLCEKMVEDEKDTSFTLYDDEPDPMSMNEEDYFKAKELYMKKVRVQSEKMRKSIEEDKLSNKGS